MICTMRRPAVPSAKLLALASALLGAACASPPAPAAPLPPPTAYTAQTSVVSAHEAATERELLERGEKAIVREDWDGAIAALELLVAAEPDVATRQTALMHLGLAYEAVGLLEKSRDRYLAAVELDAQGPRALLARQRAMALLVRLEDFAALAPLADAVLARPDLGPLDRVGALGARALARVRAGDDVRAMIDVQDGLDIVEREHVGAAGKLPPAAAQLRFALGEIRRVRSERITLAADDDFLDRMNARCQLLMDAQSAYADAMRSEDPRWATLAGSRVGEMYQALHRDLMAIGPTDKAKTEEDRQLFWGIMHVRYRVLLEKGLEMTIRTLDFAKKTGDDQSAWVKRARTSKEEMERTLADEKAALAKLPFTEEALEKTLALMEKRYKERAAKAAKSAPR
jgi:tetratricopeptide (TPR) repeat protein